MNFKFILINNKMDYKKLYEDLLNENKENTIIQSMNDMRIQYNNFKSRYENEMDSKNKKLQTIEHILEYLKNDADYDCEVVNVDLSIFNMLMWMINDLKN